MKNILLKDRLAFALDVSMEKAPEIPEIIETIGGEVGWVKMNFIFISAFVLLAEKGINLFSLIKAKGAKIWLDLKWMDIPNTVAGYVSASKGLGIDMFNVHALGTIAMMKAAIDKRKEVFGDDPDKRPLSTAISILTSIDQDALNNELKIPGSVADLVKVLAHNAKQAGCDCMVASMHEAEMIKNTCGEDFLVITPAMRFIEELQTDKRDQKRLGIPADAMDAGADIIVMGSSLIKGGLPAVRRAYAEIEEGLERRARRMQAV
ncbi:MAG: orotidine-5'-phosphate decarboxylase [Candidatus Moranbacteria bacterium]|nr:orotidine-5'-phosphate decarboxylase [Candidatus Moranbacteria bacterium]